MEPDSKKLAYWSGHHTGWQSSGLSQKAYCKREGISHSTFERWGKRVRTSANRTKPAPSPATVPLTLIPVLVASQSHHGELVLRSPSGWQLSLPATVEANWLATGGQECVISLVFATPFFALFCPVSGNGIFARDGNSVGVARRPRATRDFLLN